MDTNVKNFKYTLTCKIICFLLSFITFLAAAGLGVYTAVAEIAKIEDTSVNWYDSELFLSEFARDTLKIKTSAAGAYDLQQFEKRLDEKEEKTVNKVYNDYLKRDNPDDYFESSVHVDDEADSFYFSINTTDLQKEDISSSYEIWKFNQTLSYENNIYWYSNNHEDISGLKTLKYYCVDNRNNNVSTNLEKKPDKSKVAANPYSFIIENGELGDCQLSYPLSYYSSTEFKDVDLYVYIDLDGDSDDKYTYLVDFYNNANKIHSNPVLYIITTAVLLIISFISAFIFFSATGKNSAEQKKGKLVFIDYLPFELHIGIVAGAITGLVVLIVMLADSVHAPYIKYFILACAAALAVSWMLIFEVASSIARYAKCDKKFYKGFLIYDIFALIYIVIKFFIKLDIKIAKRNHARFKAMFYRPKTFKRNVIALIILVSLHLVFWMFCSGISALDDPYGPAAFFLVIAILPVIPVIPFLIKYFTQLDTIILSSTKHEDITMDIEKLPQSLKMLAESMKYTNAELQSAVNQAVKDERLRTELITNVSHDLKTPLTSIITYVDLLSKCDINDEKAQSYIKVLDEKGAKLKRLIEDLIEASKVTSGNIKINPININLSELCVQATVENQVEFEKAGLDLIIKPGENAPTVFADGAKTFRIIENLLSNARKYSAKASRVYASVYTQGGYGVFEIKNISAQQLDITPDELTERFVRGDKSRSQDGNGLGLSIAKELCKAQNGELEIVIDGDLFKALVKLPLA